MWRQKCLDHFLQWNYGDTAVAFDVPSTRIGASFPSSFELGRGRRILKISKILEDSQGAVRRRKGGGKKRRKGRAFDVVALGIKRKGNVEDYAGFS